MKQNIEAVKKKIATAAKRAGRTPDDITLVAVSKRKSKEMIVDALQAGQEVFGENYLQEAQEKIAALGEKPIWHFIGHIQSNKAKQVAELFDVVHTVDRLKVANALEKKLAQLNKVISVYVQVNIGRESQKSGVLPENTQDLVRQVIELPHLNFTGLMAMPPFSSDPEATRPYFKEMRSLADTLKANGLTGADGTVALSMGMSGDYEVAVEEGATIVRVGTALFGERE